MEENPKKFSMRWKRILKNFLSDGRESYKIFLSDGRESLKAFYEMEENPTKYFYQMEDNHKKLSIRWKRILSSFPSYGRESYEIFLSDGRES
jgi:hypothetical protein